MGIGDDQFHPAEATSVVRRQEGQPEGTVLARSHVNAQHLALAGAVDGEGYHHADIGKVTALPDLWLRCFAWKTRAVGECCKRRR